jgi:hypothetical protein
LVRIDPGQQPTLRISLREYANSVAKDEWPELSKGRASGHTTRLFREFTENVTAIDPKPGRQSLIYADLLKQVDDLALARENRLVPASNIKLAPIFWQTIALMFLILLVLASFSECTFSFGGAIALGCQGFVVTLLVALVFIFDRPFKRRTLSPQPITKAIAEMQNRVSTGD